MNVEAILRAKGSNVATIRPDATVERELKMHGIGACWSARTGAGSPASSPSATSSMPSPSRAPRCWRCPWTG